MSVKLWNGKVQCSRVVPKFLVWEAMWAHPQVLPHGAPRDAPPGRSVNILGSQTCRTWNQSTGMALMGLRGSLERGEIDRASCRFCVFSTCPTYPVCLVLRDHSMFPRCQTHVFDIHANKDYQQEQHTPCMSCSEVLATKKWQNPWKETENESMSQEYKSTGCKKHAPGAGGAQYPTAWHSTVQEERLERLSTGFQKQE